MSAAEEVSPRIPGSGRYGLSATGPGYHAADPSIARVWNAATGGKDNFESDRTVLDHMEQTGDDIHIGKAAKASLEFAARATAAVAELGITQWLNLGCGLPPEGYETTLQTVGRHHSDARVVYVDYDPMVTVHGRALLDVEPHTGVVEADARDVDAVLRHREATVLDLGKPVAILAAALCHFWPDSDEPGAILRRYMARFPSGYLIFSHARDDLLTSEERARLVAGYKPTGDIYARPIDVVREMFLDGLELLEPGLVEASTWRPGQGPAEDVGRAHFVVAVARFGRSS